MAINTVISQCEMWVDNDTESVTENMIYEEMSDTMELKVAEELVSYNIDF